MSEHAWRDKNVSHEAAVDAAIDDQLARTSDHGTVADVSGLSAATTIVPVDSPSSTYVQAEAIASRNAINFLITQGAATETNVISLDSKVNAILDVLRDSGLLPS